MSKRRRTYKKMPRYKNMPRYDFPRLGALLAVLVIIAVMAFLGSIAGSSDAMQTLAHGDTSAVARP